MKEETLKVRVECIFIYFIRIVDLGSVMKDNLYFSFSANSAYVFIFWAIMGLIGGFIASQKKRNFGLWFLISLTLVGLLIVLFISPLA